MNFEKKLVLKRAVILLENPETGNLVTKSFSGIDAEAGAEELYMTLYAIISLLDCRIKGFQVVETYSLTAEGDDWDE